MNEYIEREAALKILRGSAVGKYPASFYMGLFAAASEVEKIPAADVAPVVRCKDCKHWGGHEGNVFSCMREFDWFGAEADDFCSYGERKDGDG